jgi:hypothetical protein
MSTKVRSHHVLVFVGLLLGATAACSLGRDAAEEQSDAVATDLAPTAVSAGSGGESTMPTSDSSGEDGAPTLAEGDWTGGEAEVRVSGSEPMTITGQILEESSFTEGDTTLFTYAGGPTGIDTIQVWFSSEDEEFGVNAFRDEGFVDISVPYGETGCEVTYQEISGNRIEGTFRCERSEIHRANMPPEPAVMEGSFWATR